MASPAPPDSTATSPSRRAEHVRLYAMQDSCWEFVAELGLSPDGTHHHAADAPQQAFAQAEGQAEVVIAFCGQGSICGVAYLLPDAPRQDEYEEDEEEGDEEENEEYEVGDDKGKYTEKKDYEEDTDEDEEEYEVGTDEDEEDKKKDYKENTDEDEEDKKKDYKENTDEDEDEEESEDTCTVTSQSSNNRSSTDKENETEAEDDGYDDWIDWKEDDAEKQETNSDSKYSLKLRVWPSKAYANIVLFANYSFKWLSVIEAHPMLEKLADLSQLDMKLDDSKLISNAMVQRSEYEGEMVDSWAVQMFIKHKLSPSLYDFTVQELIGKGGFANVRLCTSRRDKKEYAVKIIRIKEYDPNEPREVSILSSLRSPHVVKFIQAWTETHLFVDYVECSSEDDTRKGEPIDMQRPNYVVIHMELCQTSLKKYISTNSRKIDAETLRIFKELVQGLKYIHGENVIHRDIKPANVFMGMDGIVKLGDFGQSCVHPRLADPFKGTPDVGTAYYEAPELRKNENISEKVDIHSAGAIYLELYIKFKTLAEKTSTYNEYKENDCSSIHWEGGLWLFKRMVASDPLERPSADDLVEYLSKL